MKWFVGILMGLAVILESTVTSLPLVGMMMGVVCLVGGFPLWFVFLYGLFWDVWIVHTLGWGSLELLTGYWIAFRYKKKLSFGNPVYGFLFLVVFISGYSLIYDRTLVPLRILIPALIGICLHLFLVKAFRLRESSGKIEI